MKEIECGCRDHSRVAALTGSVRDLTEMLQQDRSERAGQLARYNDAEEERNVILISMRAERDQLAAERREATERALSAEVKLACLQRNVGLVATSMETALATPNINYAAMMDRATTILQGMVVDIPECPDCVTHKAKRSEAEQKVRNLLRVMGGTAASLLAVVSLGAGLSGGDEGFVHPDDGDSALVWDAGVGQDQLDGTGAGHEFVVDPRSQVPEVVAEVTGDA